MKDIALCFTVGLAFFAFLIAGFIAEPFLALGEAIGLLEPVA